MRGVELYDRIVNWPGSTGLTTMFGVGVVLIVSAALLLSFGKLRIFARSLGVVGVALIMLAMFLIHEQTEKEQAGPYITITRSKYSPATRIQIRVTLLGLPAAAALVMAVGLSTTRRRLRALVPGYLKDGRKQLIRGEHVAALALFNKALEISPYLGDAYYQRGCTFEALGKLDQALADYDRALECDHLQLQAYLRRGRIKTERGELDAALADFNQILSVRSNDAECLLNRGICLARKGLARDAILDFHRVLKLT